jgi:hypothetical protein
MRTAPPPPLPPYFHHLQIATTTTRVHATALPICHRMLFAGWVGGALGATASNTHRIDGAWRVSGSAEGSQRRVASGVEWRVTVKTE